MNVLCFDTETNGIGGFNPPRQRVVQIAWDLNDEVTDISYLILLKSAIVVKLEFLSKMHLKIL
jgi:hypothetical protein